MKRKRSIMPVDLANGQTGLLAAKPLRQGKGGLCLLPPKKNQGPKDVSPNPE